MKPAMHKILFLLLATSIINSNLKAQISNEKFVIGYVFVKDDLIDAKSIPAKKFTHINYAFANIKNGKVVEGFVNDTENYKILNSLKLQNPGLQILVSVGGWTWSGDFSDAALTKESREIFAKSARSFLVKHKLDGVDIDWEYPNLPGYGNKHRPEDIRNFTLLMKELRKELDEQGEIDNRYYLTSAACGGLPNFIENTEMNETHKYMDFVNIMTYDLYEYEMDSITGHHGALYTNPRDPKKVSADAAIQNFINAGVPVEKLVFGFPFYGRAWGNVDTTLNGLYRKGSEVHVSTSHNSIVSNYLNKNSNYQRFWDNISQAPYLLNKKEKIFIAYDDLESVTKKCHYIKNNNLKGAMFWAFGSDYQNTYLNALNLELRPEHCSQAENTKNKVGYALCYSSIKKQFDKNNRVKSDNSGRIFESIKREDIITVAVKNTTGTRLCFPSKSEDGLINSSETDLYEDFLSKYDTLGHKVWLQIEPGLASVDELLNLVLKQYSHHKCIIGVGIDAEKANSNNENNEFTITDNDAKRWLKITQGYGNDYKIFFKHSHVEKMPPTFRNDVVFINSSQNFTCIEHMLSEYMNWGKAFYPANVGFQYGYASDKIWWNAYENPSQLIKNHIIENIPNTTSLFWMNLE